MYFIPLQREIKIKPVNAADQSRVSIIIHR